MKTRAVIGRWHGLVIDCPDPRGLASFYQALLGMQRVQDDDDWVVIADAPDRPGLAWPSSSLRICSRRNGLILATRSRCTSISR